jgi:transcription antitermination factor NusG
MSHGLIESPASKATGQSAWYALYTRHQHEKTVAQVLMGKGFEVFLPLRAAPHRWKDRIKVLSLPLFPCYVFLNGDTGRRLDVVTTPGIHSIVSYAGQPATIPASEIESIRRMVQSGLPVEPHPFLNCGDRVRVKCGPLTGVQGFLVRKRNLYRLVLSVEMLGKAVAIEIDAHSVEKMNSDRLEAHRVDRGVAPPPSPTETCPHL